MRLLIISPEYNEHGGGIGTFYRVLVEALRQEGVKIRVIEGSAFHAADDRATRTYSGIQIETLEKQRLVRWSQQFSAFAATPRLRAHLSAAWAMWEQADYGADVDLVEATDWGLLFVPPAVDASRPLIVQCHGSIGQIADHDPVEGDEAANLIVRLIERGVLSVAGVIQTHSRANATFWRAETGREVATIHPVWSSPNPPETCEVGDRGLVVGRLQRWKGSATLCEALRRLGRGAPSVDWFGHDTVWGARDHYTSEHLARTFPDVWGKRLFHHPQISPAEVTRRQSSALFNIVPSTWDPFNFTAVEAMASGRPTIVSTGAGASELIDDGVNGFLFANEDSAALAEAIERVLSESPARLAEIGREGSNAVRAALDPKTIAPQRLAAYHAAIDAFQARPRDPVNGWLGTICRPSEAVGNDMAFLENLPLRALAKHVAGRISRKVRPR
jgi:glycosyltransferase involved in cell wall biosynthesis